MKLGKLLNDALNQSKPIPLAKLRRKAAKSGWTIEIERYGREVCYWIVGTGLEDGTFCSSKEELDWSLDAIKRELAER